MLQINDQGLRSHQSERSRSRLLLGSLELLVTANRTVGVGEERIYEKVSLAFFCPFPIQGSKGNSI